MKNIVKILVLFIIAALFLLPACGSKEKASEKAAETMIENATGADVDVQKGGEKVVIEKDGQSVVIETGDKSWPGGMPSDVPEFKGDKIKGVTHSVVPEGENWTVIFEGSNRDKMESYEKALKAAGFETMSIKVGPGGTLSGEKGKIIVSCMFGEDQCVVGIQVGK